MAATFVYQSTGADDTRRAGNVLGGLMSPGDYICLRGDLGAGKTTFVQGLAAGLGVTEKYITSPSFALVNEYAGRLTLYHIDLYRLSGPEDLDDIGFSEFPGAGVVALEWPERAGDMLPERRLEISIEYVGDESRKIWFDAVGGAYDTLLEGLCRELRR